MTAEKPRARSGTEMLFAASLIPCPACKAMEPAKLDLIGSGTSWSVSGTCPRCNSRRSHAWETVGNPLKATVLPRQLGDKRPSEIIRVGQFVGELDRLLPQLRPSPAELQPLEWRTSLSAIERAITCLLELKKFVPIADARLTDAERQDRRARPERFEGAWLDGELARVLALRDKYTKDAPRIWALEAPAEAPAARGAIDREALTAHAAWVRAGRKGRGRLDVTGYSAKGLRYGGADFTGAHLERVIFDGALLDAAQMVDVELVDVSAREAVCTSIKLSGARITGGTFYRAQLALAVLDTAVIDETSFEGANFDRSTWAAATATAASFDGAVFGNAWLDAGQFRGCTFRKADFHRLAAGIKCTTRGAVFEDCDLRFTRWEGRNLDGATFIRCKLAGITGKAASLANVRIEAPDLSPEGDGSDIADADDVLAFWQGLS
ncbi:MAG: pentapeptide repeat-containing protein [Myxococcota bacterium]|nr:pentapeptide repeat-containing protein [Deltaproteobacteria bacterium]MDQ3337564.1 pentapeptide repeat-containing protein [Myxococcota bacterium]